jgi:peptidoglycan/xylan/chitin deacetylase (PgdA/CDA1 family)
MNLKFFKKIVQKNRLQAYKEVLIYAKENGYIITSLIDWYDNYINSDKKILILRHDVDYDAKGALEMFKIEKELGLKSTFYFRWLTADYTIMKAINNAGFEVSLHYETLATYAKNNNITKTDEVTPDILNLCFYENSAPRPRISTSITPPFPNIASINSLYSVTFSTGR